MNTMTSVYPYPTLVSNVSNTVEIEIMQPEETTGGYWDYRQTGPFGAISKRVWITR